MCVFTTADNYVNFENGRVTMYEWVLEKLDLGSAIVSMQRITDGLFVISTSAGETYVLKWSDVNIECEKEKEE